jgi:hypothetical protein
VSEAVSGERYKGFEPAKHHQLIISEIESFLESDDDVLLLFAPPGSAKSTYVSILLPSWYLAKNPTHSVLAATHSVEFAERWGRRVRTASDAPTALSNGHTMVWPERHSPAWPTPGAFRGDDYPLE